MLAVTNAKAFVPSEKKKMRAFMQKKLTENILRIKYFNDNFMHYFFSLILLMNALFGYELSVAAIFRDEGPYLKEWIDYHYMAGVEHFWLYNDHSKDHWEEVLKPYIEEGIVEVIDLNWSSSDLTGWISRQLQAYVDALKRTKDLTTWLGFIDIDEYLLPMQESTITECLEKHFSDAAGVYVSWRNFGTGGVTLQAGQSLLFGLTACSERNHYRNNTGKSIVRPSQVLADLTFTPHHFPLQAGCKYLNGDAELLDNTGHNLTLHHHYDRFIRINHYNTRDEKFFREVKLPRQKAMGEEKLLWELYHAFSATFDDTILHFIQVKHPSLDSLPKKSITGQDSSYLQICELAATNPFYFDSFRSNDAYAHVTEVGRGQPFAQYLAQNGSAEILKKMQEFCRLDDIGNPRIDYYPNLGIFSGTTLRYIIIADQIKKLFTLPQNPVIAEIGGGFGGQCYILSKLFPFKNYIFYDLPEPVMLIKKMISLLDVPHVSYLESKDNPGTIDLLISNYSFCEFSRALQMEYFEKVIKKSKHGYMLYNSLGKNSFNSLSVNEFANLLKENGMNPQILSESVPTEKENLLIIWN